MITISQEIGLLAFQIVEDQNIDYFKDLDKESEFSKRLLGLLLTESLMKKPFNCQYLISPIITHLSNYLYFPSLDNKEKLIIYLREGLDKKILSEIIDAATMHCDIGQVFPYRLKKYLEAFSEKIPSIKTIRDCEEQLLKKLISDTFHAHAERINDLLEEEYEKKHRDDYEVQRYKMEKEYDRNANRL